MNMEVARASESRTSCDVAYSSKWSGFALRKAGRFSDGGGDTDRFDDQPRRLPSGFPFEKGSIHTHTPCNLFGSAATYRVSLHLIEISCNVFPSVHFRAVAQGNRR
jgi:hypothetical protein